MHTFEITVQRKSDQYYPIVAESSQSAEQLPTRSEGELHLTSDTISQLLSLMGDPKEYGTFLGKLLFDGTIDDAFAMARAKSPDCLRLLLFLEADDGDIKQIRWERLCAPIDGGWNFLRRDQRVPYSLYIPSITARRFPPIGQQNLSMLVLVASPANSARFGLATFDVAETVASVRAAVGDNIRCDVLAHEVEGAVGVPSLDDLVKQLTRQSYTFLHLVCHGRQADDTALFLADHENQVKVVEGQNFIEELKNIHGPHGLPHFTFLCTCESAKQSDDGAFGGFAGQLVRDLGMPAVVAMTEKISVTTAETLIAEFYQRLVTHGEVDRALDEATATVSSRHDALVPALFSRLGGRSLFSDSLDRPLTAEEIEYGLERLQDLLEQRAPVLTDEFKQQRNILNRTLGVDVSALNDAAGKERQAALARINEMCGEVLDLSFNAVVLGKPIPAYDDRCPFRGLYPFRQDDEEFFCGREALVRTLQQKLTDHPFLAVLGDSGSGKSSLVLAGLVPALQTAQPQLRLAYMTPSYNPLEQLESSLATVKDQAFILVVDQFEELFTLCTDPDQQNLFVQQLLAIATPNQKVVFTMRADFIGSCAPYRELTQNQEVIGPMNLPELRSAMEQQARTVGLRFEAGLSNTILGEMQGERGAMPLLQHALRELWQRRHGRWLLFSEYEHFGGIRQAIAKTAEDFYEPLEPGDKRLMQNIFVRLTRLDTDTEEGDVKRDTRRRVALDELVPANGDLARTQELVARLAGEGSRLVTTSENVNTQKTEVEVAHESLIRYWPRLTRWLEDNRSNYQHREEVREDALRWQKGGCKKDDLILRNSLLEQARELQRLELLNDTEQIYVEKSFNFQEQKRNAELRRSRRNTRISVITAVIFSVLSVFALRQMWEANQQRNTAEINSIESLQTSAARFLLSDQNLDALVISVEAGRKLEKLRKNSFEVFKHDTSDIDKLETKITETLREAFYSVKEINRFQINETTGFINSLLFVPETPHLLGTFIHDDSIFIKKYSSESDSKVNNIKTHEASISETAISFDSSKLAGFSEGENRIYLWELSKGVDIKEPILSLLIEHESGLLFFIRNKSVIVKNFKLDVISERTIEWEYGSLNNAFLQFKTNKLIASSENLAESRVILDLTNELADLSLSQNSELDKSVSYFRFSPNGEQLAFILGTGEERQVGLWYVDADKVITPNINANYYATGIGFDADQIRLALGKVIDSPEISNDELIKVQGWEGQNVQSLVNYSKGKQEDTKTYFSYANGFRAVVDLEEIEETDGSVHLLNRQGRPFAVLQGGQDDIDAIGFSNTNKRIVVTAGTFNDREIIKIWDLDSEKVSETGTEEFKKLGYDFNSLSFRGNTDNGTIAATAEDGAVRFFSLEGRQQVGKTIEQHGVSFKYVSSREQRTALVGNVGNLYAVYLYDSERNKLILLEGSQTPIEIESVTLSQNGQKLAILRKDNTISAWDLSGPDHNMMMSKEMAETVLDIRINQDENLSFVSQRKTTSKDEIYVSSLQLETGEEQDDERSRIRTIAPNTEILATELDPSGNFVAMVFNSFPDRPIEDAADYPQTVLLTTREGEELLDLDTDHEIRNMTFHSSGELLATIGNDGSIKLWELGGLDELMVKACDWLQWYLPNISADLTDGQRDLCPKSRNE